MLKPLAQVAGVVILAVTAHATIDATGGYGTAQSFITLAVAAGVGIGASAIGDALDDRRLTLAAVIGLALLAGEVFNFIGTAERLVDRREAAQAPSRAAIQANVAAMTRLKAAERALADLPATDAGLARAEKQKAEADAVALAKAADKNCRENCRLLLQAQVDTATSEMVKARKALETARRAAEAELTAAREGVTRAPMPPSGTALADRLGIEPWKLDLFSAGLGSVAANGLAGALLAFATRRRRPVPQPAPPQQAMQQPATSHPAIPQPIETQPIETAAEPATHNQATRHFVWSRRMMSAACQRSSSI